MEAVAVTATCDCVSDAKPKGSKCPNCAVVLTSRQKRAVVILALVTVTLCGLMSLPSALYFSTKSSSNPISSLKCLGPLLRTANVTSSCNSFLQDFQRCLKANSTNQIFIPLPHEFQSILLALSYGCLNSSDVYQKVFLPFVCRYHIPACYEPASTLYPLSRSCSYISSDICQEELYSISRQRNALTATLPWCDSLLIDSCIENGSSMQEAMKVMELQCPDDFFPINNTCWPRCDQWETNKGVMLKISIIASGSVAVICGIAFFIVAVCQRKTSFSFPKIFVVYLNGDLIAFASLGIMTYIDRDALFCTSPNLITSIYHSSTFCNVSGAAFMYFLWHMSLLWFSHVTAMFIKLKWPLYARKFALGGYCKYIHAASITVITIVSTIPIIVVLSGSGFSTVTFPPHFCFPTDRAMTYYLGALPISALLAAGSSLIAALIYIINKHHHVLKRRQSTDQLSMSVAERKLFLIFCYYVLLGTMVVLALYKIAANDQLQYEFALQQYFLCSKSGASSDCKQYKDKVEALTTLELSMAAYVMMGLFPAVSLFYAIHVERLLTYCGLLRERQIEMKPSQQTIVVTVTDV